MFPLPGQNNKNAWPFIEPVDPDEVPNYYKVIKEPMGESPGSTSAAGLNTLDIFCFFYYIFNIFFIIFAHLVT